MSAQRALEELVLAEAAEHKAASVALEYANELDNVLEKWRSWYDSQSKLTALAVPRPVSLEAARLEVN